MFTDVSLKTKQFSVPSLAECHLTSPLTKPFVSEQQIADPGLCIFFTAQWVTIHAAETLKLRVIRKPEAGQSMSYRSQ